LKASLIQHILETFPEAIIEIKGQIEIDNRIKNDKAKTLSGKTKRVPLLANTTYQLANSQQILQVKEVSLKKP
jgi:hypothetical protein